MVLRPKVKVEPGDHYEVFVTVPESEVKEPWRKEMPDWLHIDVVRRISNSPTVSVWVNNEVDFDRAVAIAVNARSHIETSGLLRNDEILYVLVWPAHGGQSPTSVVISQAA